LLLLWVGDSPPPVKVCKVFELESLSLDFDSA
jgi:hypothetical protein